MVSFVEIVDAVPVCTVQPKYFEREKSLHVSLLFLRAQSLQTIDISPSKRERRGRRSVAMTTLWLMYCMRDSVLRKRSTIFIFHIEAAGVLQSDNVIVLYV
jgi:hypothetical protein